MLTVPHRLPQTRRLVRVVRDARDRTKDYFISQARADKLYVTGRLEMIQCYANRWDFATRRGEIVR